MSDKVDFSKKKKGNNKKIKILGIALISVLVIYILIQSIIRAYKSMPEKVPEQSKIHYSTSQYKTLAELLKSFECELINKEEIDNILKLTVNFNMDLYTKGKSNENYFLGICNAVAEFQKYKTFQIIDKSREIDIEVICENERIVQIKINGDENYYLNQDSKINSNKKVVEFKNFTIQSLQLQQLIESDWKENQVSWGTKESTCNGYNIYFDEGIEYKVVGRNVFNVIFTSKYNGQIAGGLNTNSTIEEVKSALGEPTFSNGTDLYGYRGENNYLFFDFLNNQISVYPIVEVTSEEEEKLKIIIRHLM